MGKSSKDFKIKNNNPGPGNYTIFESKINGGSYKMKNEAGYAHDKLNSNINKSSPGAGSYDPNFSNKFENISYSIRNKTTKDKYSKVPGPGSYQNIQKKSNQPQFS